MLRAGLVRRAWFWDAAVANWAIPKRELEFRRVAGSRPEAKAFDWSAACDRCRDDRKLAALIAQREQRVRAILDSIDAPGVGYLIGGSKATYPISDCDVTVINRDVGAGAHRVVAEFYRRFRDQHGVEPETMFDANVFANFPELTAHWVPWDDPRLRAILEDPRFVKRRNASQLAVAFARVARDLGPFRFNLAAERLEAVTAFRGGSLQTLVPALDRAERLGVSTKDRIVQRWRFLCSKHPQSDRIDLWRRAGNELFCEKLAEAAPVLARLEALIERALRGERVGVELQRTTLQIDQLCMEASLFKVNDYATRGAMKHVLRDDAVLKVGPTSAPSTSDLLASLIENFAAVGKGLLPHLDEGLPIAAIRSSKYAVRFWDAATDLADALGDPALAARLSVPQERVADLRRYNKELEHEPWGLQLWEAQALRRSFRGPMTFDRIRGVTARLIARAMAEGA